MSQTTNDQSSTFLVGFTWGLIAGAAGYFLFGTDQGKKVRQQIAQEWNEQVDQLTETGARTEKVSLREAVVSFIHGLTSENEAQPAKSSAIKASSKAQTTP